MVMQISQIPKKISQKILVLTIVGLGFLSLAVHQIVLNQRK